LKPLWSLESTGACLALRTAHAPIVLSDERR
jgi:hypothetical protein